MVLQVSPNKDYGGATARDKYGPLSNVSTTGASARAECSAILQNRCDFLRTAGSFPKPMTFYMEDTGAAIAGQNNRPPPLVVVSSNRSKWIAAGMNTGRRALAALPGKPASFVNIRDERAFGHDLDDAAVSPPIYASYRQGPDSIRPIYVVVHASEYAEYCTNLTPYNIVVVGWKLEAAAPDADPLAGFGMSRYAAIAFCKALRAEAKAAGADHCWNAAWLIDDNVVGMGRFPDFATAEATLDPAWACLGFKGLDTAGTRAATLKQFSRTTAPGDAPRLQRPATKGLIQQVVLWNIAKLATDRINFSPTYVASAEDLSLTRYFDINTIPYRFYKPVTIYKEAVGGDYYDGSDVFQNARRTTERDFVVAEATPRPPGAGGTPPPPIQVRRNSRAATVTARAFATDPVVAESTNIADGDRADVAVLNKAACQVSEYITKQAIGRAQKMTPESMAAAFTLPEDAVTLRFQDLDPAVAGGADGDDSAGGGDGDDSVAADGDDSVAGGGDGH